MTELATSSIFQTADHNPTAKTGIEACVAVDAAGVVQSVAIIDEAHGEMVELPAETALAIAKALVAHLEGRVGLARRQLH